MRALSKAEALAEDFHDWYELAETAAKSELGADVVRRALDGQSRWLKTRTHA